MKTCRSGYPSPARRSIRRPSVGQADGDVATEPLRWHHRRGMKAAHITAPGRVSVVEVEEPQPQADHAVIRPQIVSICGSDLKSVYDLPDGDYPLVPGAQRARGDRRRRGGLLRLQGGVPVRGRRAGAGPAGRPGRHGGALSGAGRPPVPHPGLPDRADGDGAAAGHRDQRRAEAHPRGRRRRGGDRPGRHRPDVRHPAAPHGSAARGRGRG